MSVSWSCPHCGGDSNHFSRNRNALVCDMCGTIIQTASERDEEINFERKMTFARQHLQVGNWEEAKRLIKSFCYQRPTDKQLYLMLLVAETKCYSDFLFNNYSACQEAADYWDKLIRLGCINDTMKDYARRRVNYIQTERSLNSAKKSVAISICVFLTVIAFCLIGLGNAGGYIFLVLAIASWIISLKWITNNWINTKKIRPYREEDDNPFRY